MTRRHTWIIAALLALWVSPPLAAATVVRIVGIFGKKVVLSVNNGTPIMVAVGDTAQNIKVLDVSQNTALLFFDEKEQRLTLGEGAYASLNSAGKSAAGTHLVLTADQQGHFSTVGSINGANMRFLVDTGATLVALSTVDARRAGIDLSNAKTSAVNTAGGVVRQYLVVLDTLKVGDIELRNIEAGVIETPLPFVLLGGSFLNRMELKRDGNTLTIDQRF